MNERTKGILFALCAAGISGFSIFYNKLIIIKGIDPHVLNVMKNGGAALCLSILWLIRTRNPKHHGTSPRRMLLMITIGVIGGGIPFILYFEGLKSVSAVSANLIHKSMFLWVAALAIPILHERLRVWQIAGYLLVAIGTITIGGFEGYRGTVGELFILTATLLWSVEQILVKRIARTGEAGALARARMLYGLPVLLLFIVFTGRQELLLSLPASLWLPAAGSIVLLTGYVYCWYNALERAPVSVVASLLVLAVPITSMLTGVFLTHTIPASEILGIVTLIAGTGLIAVLSRQYKETVVKTSPA